MNRRCIRMDRTDNYAVITLDRPKANALSCEFVAEIRDAVQELRRDSQIGAIVITGGPGRFFSGGADIPSLQAALGSPFAPDSLLTAGLAMMEEIEKSTKPVIAAVNGIAVGGGCELALACHIRIASDSAQFGQPEINLGIVPGWGGCHRLPRLVGDSRALEWLLTGRMVSAVEALEAGLVCRVVPHAQLLEAARELATQLSSKPRTAVRGILRAVRERAERPEAGKALEAEAFTEAAADPDAAEGITAFLEKRPPRFQGR